MARKLDHSAADIIRNLLVDDGVATLPSASDSWPAEVNLVRDKPDSAITVNDTAGVHTGRAMVGGQSRQAWGIQVQVRGVSQTVAVQKAEDIYQHFDDVLRQAVTVGSTNYIVQAIHNSSPPVPVGLESDASSRFLYTVNALCAIRKTS